jgi:hypothetical protein
MVNPMLAAPPVVATTPAPRPQPKPVPTKPTVRSNRAVVNDAYGRNAATAESPAYTAPSAIYDVGGGGGAGQDAGLYDVAGEGDVDLDGSVYDVAGAGGAGAAGGGRQPLAVAGIQRPSAERSGTTYDVAAGIDVRGQSTYDVAGQQPHGQGQGGLSPYNAAEVYSIPHEAGGNTIYDTARAGVNGYSGQGGAPGNTVYDTAAAEAGGRGRSGSISNTVYDTAANNSGAAAAPLYAVAGLSNEGTSSDAAIYDQAGWHDAEGNALYETAAAEGGGRGRSGSISNTVYDTATNDTDAQQSQSLYDQAGWHSAEGNAMYDTAAAEENGGSQQSQSLYDVAAADGAAGGGGGTIYDTAGGGGPDPAKRMPLQRKSSVYEGFGSSHPQSMYDVAAADGAGGGGGGTIYDTAGGGDAADMTGIYDTATPDMAAAGGSGVAAPHDYGVAGLSAGMDQMTYDIAAGRQPQSASLYEVASSQHIQMGSGSADQPNYDVAI